MADDPTEVHDLAEREPDRLADLVERWWVEARNNQVLPLDNRVLHTIVHPKPDRRAPRLRFTYYPGTSSVPETVAANVKNRSHVIEADLTVDDDGVANGVVLAQGSVLGGFSLYLLDGVPRYVHNLYGKERHVVAATEPIPPGRHRLSYRFERAERVGRQWNDLSRRAGGGRGRDTDLHGRLLQRHRLRPHLWVRSRSAGGRGL